jgi:hypothetical protein
MRWARRTSTAHGPSAPSCLPSTRSPTHRVVAANPNGRRGWASHTPTERGLDAVRTVPSDAGRGPHIHHTGELAVRRHWPQPRRARRALTLRRRKSVGTQHARDGVGNPRRVSFGRVDHRFVRNRNGCAPAVRMGHSRIRRPSRGALATRRHDTSNSHASKQPSRRRGYEHQS